MPVLPDPAPAAPVVAPAVASPPPAGGQPVGRPRRDAAGVGSDVSPAPTRPRPENLDWHAVLDDGRRLVVDHLVLLGRNPQPAPGEEDAQLIKIADETRTVSKLHLALGVDQAGCTSWTAARPTARP